MFTALVAVAGLGWVIHQAPGLYFRGPHRSSVMVMPLPPEQPTAASAVLVKDDIPAQNLPAGLTYTNYQVASVPWSIHVVRVDRSNPLLEIHSVHARGSAIGLSTLSSQVALASATLGVPLAAVNGDFYQRNRTFLGDPRGLQVVEGEVISAPHGGATLWIDTNDQPHLENVVSRFRIRFPNGAAVPCGLNEERSGSELVLYTPALGPSTRAFGGRELVLESADAGPWLPLRMGQTYRARVRRISETGNTPLDRDTMILSAGSAAARRLPALEIGARLEIVTESSPAVSNPKTAIGGGPMLVHEGQVQEINPSNFSSYEDRSMVQRHPRAAIGWNAKCYFLVEVDGRQWDLSIGMTLEELAAFMAQLGCQEAMNFDGGGSAMLWYRGRIQNSPCDGRERAVANSIVVTQKSVKNGKPATQASLSSEASEP